MEATCTKCEKKVEVQQPSLVLVGPEVGFVCADCHHEEQEAKMPGPKDSYDPTATMQPPMTALAMSLLNAAEEWQKTHLDVGDGEETRWNFFKENYRPLAFVKEFRTLRLGGPRVFGNSTAAVHVAWRLCAGLVVVPYVAQADVLWNIDGERHHAHMMSVLSMQQVRNKVAKSAESSYAFGPFNSIVVDGASYMERNTPDFIDLLATLLDIDKKGWLVLIG